MKNKCFTLCLFVVVSVLIGVCISCDGELGTALGDSQAEKIFIAYDELLETLEMEEEIPKTNRTVDKEAIENVEISVNDEMFICDGSLKEEGSSRVLRVTLRAESLEKDYSLEVTLDNTDEVISFLIDDIDYTERYEVYVASIPLETYLITYHKESFTGSVPEPQIKVEGEPVIIEGNTGNLQNGEYIFSGWISSFEHVYAPGDTYDIDEDLDLYARWEAPPTYYITYFGNGNTSGDIPSSQTKSSGESVTIESNSGDMTKPGYSFEGWNTQANGEGSFYSSGSSYSTDADLSLYAQWKKIGFAEDDGYPIIEGLAVDRSYVGSIDVDDYVLFEVKASSPDSQYKLLSAKVYISQPTWAPIGSQPYTLVALNREAAGYTVPDIDKYDGYNSAGTFYMALKAEHLKYQGIWTVSYIEVISQYNTSTGPDQRMTSMHQDDVHAAEWDFTIEQRSSDAIGEDD